MKPGVLLIYAMVLALHVTFCRSNLLLNVPEGVDIDALLAALNREGNGTFEVSDVNECDQANSCPDNSNCTNNLGSFSCACLGGFVSGGTNDNGDTNCTDVDECAVNSTLCDGTVGSKCVNNPGSFSCSCNHGFDKNDNESECVDVDECKNGGCASITGSDCSNSVGSFSCDCKTGFERNANVTSCVDIDECEDTTICIAIVDAICNNAPGSYSCDCADGFQKNADSSACEDIDECKADADPCTGITDSTCDNKEGSYECACALGYRVNAEETACENINECDVMVMTHDCGTNEVCEDNEGSYTCRCASGYEGNPPTESCRDTDECKTTPCDENAFCFNSAGSYQCRCKTGFYGSGDNGGCTDVMSCGTFYNIKDSISTILNAADGEDITTAEKALDNYNSASGKTDGVPGHSFRARFETEPGAELNSHIVNIIDDLRCDYFSTCAEDGESYTCTCDDGYEFAGNSTTQCQDKDECNPNLCGAMATCANEQGSFDCTCPDGYEIPSGEDKTSDCADLDECSDDALNNCTVNAECQNTIGSFTCQCKDGFMGSGKECDSALSCDAFNTVRTAIDTIRGAADGDDTSDAETIIQYYIDAGGKPPGVLSNSYTAKFGTTNGTVAIAIDLLRCDYFSECSSTEADGETTYTCTCASGYNATDSDVNQCEDNDECTLKPGTACSATGTCENNEGSYSCVCDDGFEGGVGGPCTDVDECVSDGLNECGMTGTCENKDRGYTCACNSGYEGGDTAACTDIDECVEGTHNCSADATCNNIDASFTCECKTGYEGSGQACIDINECTRATDNCDSTNGNCTNNEGSFTCNCNDGFVGSGYDDDCENINECTSDPPPCHAELGECVDNEGSYECSCKGGYEGDGKTCTDINECDDPALNTCDKEVGVCENTDGSYECRCDSEYMGSGQNGECTSVLTCSTFNDLKSAIEVLQNENSTETDIVAAEKLLTEYVTAEGLPVGVKQNAFRSRYPGELNAEVEVSLDLLRCDYFAACSYDEDTSAYGCACMEGYVEDTENGGCKDVDECSGSPGSHDCHVDATCKNRLGSYDCECNAGYFGNGRNCSDHDECTGEGGGHDCDPNATCDNVEGGHTCKCNASYFGEGHVDTCEDISTCDTFNKVKSAIAMVQSASGSEEDIVAARKTLQEYAAGVAASALAVVPADSYRQRYGDSLDSDIENVIGSLICDYHSTCDNSTGANTCTCKSGYFPGESEKTCLSVQTCDAFDRVKSAITTARESSDMAEVMAVEKILSAFADAGAHATPANSSAYMARYPSEAGKDYLNALVLLPCDYFSECSGELMCTCIDGYEAAEAANTCRDSDECENGVNNCHDDAECTDSEGSFECACKSGFVGNGTDCEDTTDCTSPDSTLCGANAVCMDTPGLYECNCNDGYAGNGLVCVAEISCLFGEDSDADVTNCDDFDHPLSCSFNVDFGSTATAHFEHYQSYFHPPAGLTAEATRNATDFDASSSSTGGQSICIEATTYISPNKAFTDRDMTTEVELFSFGCHRQWFTQTECVGSPTGINIGCNTVRTEQTALVITKSPVTGKYTVTSQSIYLPSSCRLQFVVA